MSTRRRVEILAGGVASLTRPQLGAKVVEVVRGRVTAGGTGEGGGTGTVAWSTILNKPTFAVVATSGAYSDLSGKPVIPTIASHIGAATPSEVTAAADAARARSNHTGVEVFTMPTADGSAPPAIRINQDNATDANSAELMQVWIGGVKTSWLNEWGAPRVRIPVNKSGDAVFKGLLDANYAGVPFQIIKDGSATYQFCIHADGSFSSVQTTAPAAPPALMHRLYVKADGNWYTKNSAGVEKQVGGSGGPVGLDDLPAGSMVSATWSGSWPARPTSRTDITVTWISSVTDPAPSGFLDGDLWIRPS